MPSSPPHRDAEDDVHSQYLIVVAEACVAAATASLAVQVLLATGQRVSGVPTAPPPPDFAADEADETGYAKTFAIADTVVRLEDVIALTILGPEAVMPAAG